MSAAWPLPASMRIFERGWLSANNILFIGRDQTALVDSGYLTHAPQTLALVRHGLKDRPLDLLLNTHLHSDHCGGNAALQAHYGSFTAIPAAGADAVRAWDEDALSYKATALPSMPPSPRAMSWCWATCAGRRWPRPATTRTR
jgi:glyoxylase-like metal-dependent hydrolase (beta-lactamase superfamily II)